MSRGFSKSTSTLKSFIFDFFLFVWQPPVGGVRSLIIENAALTRYFQNVRMDLDNNDFIVIIVES